MNTFLDSVTRGVDGLVGRMVDRLGGDAQPQAEVDEPGTERVWLLAYSVISVRRDDPRLLRRGEIIEVDVFDQEGTAARLIQRTLRREANLGPEDERFLRVHLSLLDSWCRPREGRGLPEEPRPATGDRAGEVLMTLRYLGAEASLSEIRDELGWPRGRVRYWLQQLIREGLVQRRRDGARNVYSPAEGARP